MESIPSQEKEKIEVSLPIANPEVIAPSTSQEGPVERKPFDIIEELKKPCNVGINPAYVLPIDSVKRSSSIVSETGQGKNYKTKRSRTDIGLKKRDECDNLCRSAALGKECPYGASCKYDHDVAAYFARRQPDIGPMCPVFELHGYCPMGLNCRWAMSHTSVDDLKLISKPEEEQIPIVELNECKDIPMQLQKKKYIFEFDSWKKECNNQKPDTEKRKVIIDMLFLVIGALADAEQKPVDFRHKIYIAPLTTVGNLPFRRICVDFGADITCGEMAMCDNLLRGRSSEWALLRRHPCEKVFGVQVATGRVEDAGYVCELIRREMSVDFIDLNAGCPIDVLERIGGGAALLGKPGKLKRILECMLGNIGDIPLVVKVRTGDNENTMHKLLPQLQQLQGRTGNRLYGVTIHGRTKQMRYTKTADWDYIKQCALSLCDNVHRPFIIGNGDIFDYNMYCNQIEDGTLDGVMIGRGALIKPWLSTEIKEKRNWDISAGERLEIIKTYCSYGLEHWGSDEQGVSRTRRFLLEWMSFLCRYVPYGLLERPQRIEQKPYAYFGRSDLETLLGSNKPGDWVKISEMFLGPAPSDFNFLPKHKSNAYTDY